MMMIKTRGRFEGEGGNITWYGREERRERREEDNNEKGRNVVRGRRKEARELHLSGIVEG